MTAAKLIIDMARACRDQRVLLDEIVLPVPALVVLASALEAETGLYLFDKPHEEIKFMGVKFAAERVSK